MNSSLGNDVDSSKLLIDWCSPEMVINKTYDGNFINNPFDILEVEAANMDPMHLVQNQTLLKEDPPCCNFFSPLWEPKVRQIRKSVSLTDFDNFGKIVETNYSELVKINYVEDKLQVCDTNVMCGSDNTSNQSNENGNYQSVSGNCIFADVSKNIIEINEEFNIESIFTQDLSKVNIEHKSLCNEEEKKQIRKQTRQRIEMLIEKEKLRHKEKCSQKSFIFSTPKKHWEKSNASLRLDKSLFNRGFLKNVSYSHFDSFSSSKIFNVSLGISNTLNDSPVFSVGVLNSFDLSSLKPEWVVDDFSDSDTSIDVQTKDKSMTELGLANNCIETDESTPIGTKTVVKSSRPNKNPCLAYVPLQHMVQDNDENEFKDPNRQSDSEPKPVAFSTPTMDTPVKSFVSAESSLISRKSSLTRLSWPHFAESPKTSLNITKCIQKHSINMLYDENGNTPIRTNVLNSKKPANKRSNSSTNLVNDGAIEKKTTTQKCFQLNKSKSESKIGNISKPTVFNTNQISGLPVLKRSTMMLKGKENVKPE